MPMRFMKVLIGEKEGGDPCFAALPECIRDGTNVRCEITQCTPTGAGGGCSIVSITDPDGVLTDEIAARERCSSEFGECTIDRVSANRMIGIINNKNCKISRIVSDCGCFITSCCNYEGDRICWTVMGPNTSCLQNMVKRIRNEGYPVETISSSSNSIDTMLSSKQDEILRMAFENGYYDVPKRITLDELSELAGCTKSSLNVTLRNAEYKLIAYYYLGNRDSTNKS